MIMCHLCEREGAHTDKATSRFVEANVLCNDVVYSLYSLF